MLNLAFLSQCYTVQTKEEIQQGIIQWLPLWHPTCRGDKLYNDCCMMPHDSHML